MGDAEGWRWRRRMAEIAILKRDEKIVVAAVTTGAVAQDEAFEIHRNALVAQMAMMFQATSAAGGFHYDWEGRAL